ncbi:putative ABC transporter ATP-binding protein [Clostridium ragsdalei P11]|uniref:Putative ABC transporter ATP-binding protein n=1 Tax=Clostridium ragsdalei P11 TaxID=1353534 RepID=A0A1A6AVQ8_9CLOT|nr:ABC transporter ATP-binding protein [Clostridium ragsdalei]OBR94169.1 putative ABC transporter ATP-binding protein [Clostridium ragsdalei P11]
MFKMFQNLRNHIPYVCTLIVLIFAQIICDLYLPTLMSSIINNGIMEENIPYILRFGGVMLFVSGFGIICAVIASFLSAHVSADLGSVLRSRVFRCVESLSLHEFDNFGASTLTTRTTNDIIQIQTFTILMLNMMLRAPLTAVGGIILAYRQDKGLTVIFAMAFPVLVALIAIVMGTAMPAFKHVQTKLDKVNLVMAENLKGILVIRAFNRIDHENRRFDYANSDLTATYIKANQIMSFLLPGFMLAINAIVLFILWFGSIRVNTGEMNIGALTAFLQYAVLIFSNFVMFSIMFVFLPRAQTAAQRVSEVLETRQEILEPVIAKIEENLKGVVEFRNVTFRYPGAEQPAISGISFLARPGETTAIIGGTGSGKSTLVGLIPRFYDVSEGKILLDEINVKDMAQKELRVKIGFVPQTAVLFTGTIADNLRYGRKRATNEELEYAAKTAQAADFIAETENGYDTMLSEGGGNLSGGQKQRLSIARALVRHPEIYIFDDSFSALDFKTDAALRAALQKETENATVFIVAQRVGTVMNADRIIVLDNGAVAGMGTHEELIKSCGIYQDIVSSQFSEEEMV